MTPQVVEKILRQHLEARLDVTTHHGDRDVVHGAVVSGVAEASLAICKMLSVDKIDAQSRSYPFLALAQRHGLDYGAVLDAADYLQTRNALDRRTRHAGFWLTAQPEHVRDEIRSEVERQSRISSGEEKAT
jgi:hypothetical protein